jgi:hypothetical protein
MARKLRIPQRFLLLQAIWLLVPVSACAPPLLAPDEPRSQFDRYDSVRNQHEDQYIFNEHAKRQPNLERRLSHKE